MVAYSKHAPMPSAVTVGNSDGIGLALTRLLVDKGWRVVGFSRRPSSVASSGYTHHTADVCSPDYPELLSSALSALERVDVCVYCAGIGEFLDIETLHRERQVFETNLLGAVSSAQVVIPRMVRAGRGQFIGLSSQADAMVDSNAPSYAASKAALSSYLEGLSLACRPRGVRVTNLRLGFVDTKMAKGRHRPFMVSRVQAARRIWRCIQKRPMRDTYPKRMAVLLWMLRVGQRVRNWLD